MSNRRIAVLGAATLAACLGAAAPASAANYTCEASAVRGQVLSVLGLPAIEPVTANKGAATCAPQRGGGASLVPAPLNAILAPNVLFAETTLTGPQGTPAAQTAGASGGLADLRLGLPTVNIPPLQQAIEQVQPVTLPTGLVLGALLGVQDITLDLRPALRAALQPNVELLRIQALAAYAKAQCVDGKLALEGTSQTAGLKLLGQDLILNGAIEQTLQLLGGQTIDPSTLDITKIGLPPVVTPNLLGQVQPLLRPLLDAVPDITLPATVAAIRITPGAQTRTATSLTQQALTLTVDIAGQRLIDLTLGEAKVGANGIECATAPPTSAAQAALQCTTRRLVLIDVLPGSKRVQLYGAADKRYIGRTVDIHFVPPFGGGPRVARAKVRRDGTFRTSAPLPPRKIRGTNRARYQARIGKERSLRLKLQRRMIVRSVRVANGKVRITGRVTRPLANPARSIEVRRRVSCKKWVVVKRIKPSRTGSFSTSVDAPESQLAGTYRFATKVRKTRRNPKTYPTFTLPRYVDQS